MKVRDEMTLPWPRTRENVARKLARYYASTEYWDAAMGRVIQALRDAGQFENTIFIIAGDNGLSLGEHGLLGKQNLYEFGGMHVPLILAGKGIPKGETRSPVYLMDVFPTLCELIGTPIPARVEGLSLAPVIRGEKPRVREFILNAYRDQPAGRSATTAGSSSAIRSSTRRSSSMLRMMRMRNTTSPGSRKMPGRSRSCWRSWPSCRRNTTTRIP